MKVVWCQSNNCNLMAEVEDVHFNYIDKILITEPTYHDEYNSGDDLTVKWDYEPNGGINQTVSLNIYTVKKDGTTELKTDCQWNGEMTEKSHTFFASCFTLGDDYKFELIINDDGKGRSDSVFSDIISYDKPSISHSIDIYKPEMGAFFKSGETLTVKWEAFDWESDAKVNIYLYKDSLGPDSLLYSTTDVPVSSESFSFKIPDKSVVGSGTEFYIYIGYDCGRFLCSEGFYSKTFGINWESPFIITTEIDNNYIYFPGFDREVTWTTKRTKPEKIYVKLKAENPTIIKLLDKTLDSVETTATALSAILHPDEGSVRPVYYQISYDCWFFGYVCSKVKSKTFDLIDFHSRSWNEDQNGKVLKPDKSLAEVSCKSNCNSTSSSLFCKACNAGVEMSASATCENCHARVRAGFYGLNLDFSGFSVKTFQIGFYGRVDMDIHVDMKASVTIEKEYNVPLFKYTPAGFQFYIGPISITLGISLNLDLPVTFNLSGSLDATIDSTGALNVFADAKYGESIPSDEQGVFVHIGKDENLSPRYKFNFHADATLSVGLQIGITASVSSILTLTGAGQLAASLHGEFDRFPALKTEKLIEDSFLNYGSCLNPHYLQYDLTLDAGIRADAKFLFLSSPLFEKKYKWPALVTILSGCLIPMETKDETNKISSKLFQILGLSRHDLPFSDDVLEIGLANELCKAMGWPKGRLIITVENSTKVSDEDDSVNLTGVNVTLLPVTAEGKQKTSTRKELAGRLASALNDLDSDFYYGFIGKYFKGKFAEQNVESYSSLEESQSSSNNIIEVKSTSSLSVPYLNWALLVAIILALFSF